MNYTSFIITLTYNKKDDRYEIWYEKAKLEKVIISTDKRMCGTFNETHTMVRRGCDGLIIHIRRYITRSTIRQLSTCLSGKQYPVYSGNTYETE